MFESVPYKCDDVFIRLIEQKDLEMLREHRNDYSTWINLSDTTLIYKDQQESWYNKLIADKTKKYFIAYVWEDIETVGVTAKPIGLIRIDEIDYINSSARVGCDVFKNSRYQGYGTKIMQVIINYCFKFMNIQRLWLCVAEYNEAAITLYKKVGFVEEGRQIKALYRDGRYHDYIQMSLLRERHV